MRGVEAEVPGAPTSCVLGVPQGSSHERVLVPVFLRVLSPSTGLPVLERRLLGLRDGVSVAWLVGTAARVTGQAPLRC